MPDFTLAVIKSWRFDPRRSLEVYSIEVKRRSGTSVASVYEAVAHGRFAHHPYLVCPGSTLVEVLKECIADLHLVVEAANNHEGDFQAAFAEFRYRTTARLRGYDLVLRWEVALDDLPSTDPRTILQLLRIIQKLVTNAVKHSCARSLHLSAEFNSPVLKLVVQDDGVGLSQPLLKGRGLNNIEQRVREIGAKWRVESAKSGVTFTLTLSLVEGKLAGIDSVVPGNDR